MDATTEQMPYGDPGQRPAPPGQPWAGVPGAGRHGRGPIGPRPSDPRPTTEALAIAALWCSIAGILLGLPTALGIVFGFMARARIRRSEGGRRGSGLALAGIIVGTTAVVVWGAGVLGAVFQFPNDQQLAQGELLPGTAYPAGWASLGAGNYVSDAGYFDGDSPLQVAQVTACLGMGSGHVDANPVEAEGLTRAPISPVFAVHGTTYPEVTVDDSVDVFPSSGQAGAEVEAAGRRGAVTCAFRYWGSSVTAALADQVGLGPTEKAGLPTVRPARAPTRAGRRDADESFSFPYAYEGRTVTVYVDWVTVQVGRSDSVLSFTDLGAPVSSRVIDRLSRAAADQMAGG